MRSLTALTAGVLVFGLAACAGPRASADYQSRAGYDKLYAASLSAVSDVGFTVTSASKADGLIVAQQGVVLGSGSTVGMNATISREMPHILHVSIVAPPASFALGSFDGNLNDYINAVRARVPDVQPISVAK